MNQNRAQGGHNFFSWYLLQYILRTTCATLHTLYVRLYIVRTTFVRTTVSYVLQYGTLYVVQYIVCTWYFSTSYILFYYSTSYVPKYIGRT